MLLVTQSTYWLEWTITLKRNARLFHGSFIATTEERLTKFVLAPSVMDW